MANRMLGPSGGHGGSSAEDEVPAGATITSIEIVYGSYVNAVRLNWDLDGRESSVGLIGREAGPNTATVPLAGLQIRAFLGSFGSYVNQLSIVTDDHNTHGPYGRTPGPAPFQYEIPAGSDLVGLVGRTGSFVDAFGVIVSDCSG